MEPTFERIFAARFCPAGSSHMAAMRKLPVVLFGRTISVLPKSPNRWHGPRRPASTRGTLRPIVTKREAGCDGRVGLRATIAGESGRAKSCGPGLPTLRSTLRAQEPGGTGANKPGTPRRSRISREPSRRECRHVRRTCDDLRACSLFLCTQGNGCVSASGIPCALSLPRANGLNKTWADCAAGTRWCVLKARGPDERSDIRGKLPACRFRSCGRRRGAARG
jgi:hypothetical protein